MSFHELAQKIARGISYSDDVTVPSFGPRMVCTACGAIDADARPNWNERAPATLFGPHRTDK